jgi:hypothetical protein
MIPTRLCIVHHRPLEDGISGHGNEVLICPAGHRVKEWLAVDHKARATRCRLIEEPASEYGYRLAAKAKRYREKLKARRLERLAG